MIPISRVRTGGVVSLRIRKSYGHIVEEMERFYSLRRNIEVAAARPRFQVPEHVSRLGATPAVNLTGVSDRYTLHVGFALLKQSSTLQVPRNLLQVKTDAAECSPCVDFVPSSATAGAITLQQSGASWTTTMSVAVSGMLNTEHLFVVASLEGRKGSVHVYRGVNASGTLLGSDSVESPGSSLEYGAASVLFGATRAAAPLVANGFVHTASFEVLGTMLGGALGFWPVVDSAVQVNSAIHFRGNRTSLRTSRLRFGSPFTTDPTLSTDAPRAGAKSVCFSGASGLAHNSSDARFQMGPLTTAVSSCVWFKQTSSYATIFPTVVDGPAAMHKYAFSDDVAVASGDLYGSGDLRASPTSAAEPVFGSWNLLCASQTASGRQLFMNSSLVASDSNGGFKTGVFGIGATTDSNVMSNWGVTRSTHACLADPVLWARELSAADVAVVYSSGLAGGVLNA